MHIGAKYYLLPGLKSDYVLINLVENFENTTYAENARSYMNATFLYNLWVRLAQRTQIVITIIAYIC